MISLSIDREARQGQTYTASIDFESVGQTTEKGMIYLKNPSDSGVRVFVTHLVFSTDCTSTRSKYRVYLDPTTTADGTSLTVNNCAAIDSPPSSAIELYKYPTVTANGDLVTMKQVPAASPSFGQNRVFLIDPGHELLASVTNDIINAATFVQIYWVEAQ